MWHKADTVYPVFVLVFALLLATPPAQAKQIIEGPIPAEVVEVVDGDTVNVRARIWLDQEIFARIRVDGIDTPEKKAKCERERRLALKARDRAEALLGGTVVLRDVRYGKYAGRVVARVVLGDGRDLAEVLIAEGHGRPYSGRGKRLGWCD